MKDHPDQLKNVQDFKQLKGFGDAICKRIAQKLAEVNGGDDQQIQQINFNPEEREQSEPQITQFMAQKKKRSLIKTPNRTSNDSPLPKLPKTKSNRNYIPSEGSGAYAILMALIVAESEEGTDSMSKQELSMAAQEFATTSITTGTNGSHYSGWNSVKTLLNKNLVEKSRHRMASFYLTESGRQLALKLYQMLKEKRTVTESQVPALTTMSSDDTQTSDSESIISEPNNRIQSQTSHSSNSLSDRFSLIADSYEIVLCVDTREQATGVNRDMRKTGLLSILQQNGVKVEMRTLSVGDFTWIAKQKTNFGHNMANISGRSRKELVLDLVIERKRIDDLASSLKDRRWDEQKYRLINCGVRKPSYIIEYFGQNSRRSDFGGIECDTLDQAIANAQTAGFLIKRCDSYEDTVRYLTLMSRYLESHFKNKTLYSCSKDELINNEVGVNHFMSFAEFGRNSNKITNFTVSEMFLKHLLQIKGVSVIKAKVIVDHYPTLQSLLDAFSIAETAKDKQNLLSSLKCSPIGRNLGPNLSKKIYQFYCR